MKMQHIRRSRGFTLIEMLIVVVIIGILVAIIAPRFTSAASKGTKSLALDNFVQNAAVLTQTLNQTLGTPANVTNDGTVASNTGSWLDVLIYGHDCVKTAYQTAYDASGAGTLDKAVKVTTATDCAAGGTPAAYEVQGYAVTSFVSPADGSLHVTYAAVPDDLVLDLRQKKDGDTTLAAGGSTTGRVQYGAATANGLRDMTIVTSIR